jgi:uncharacterized protein (TIGR02448 family)
MRRTLLCLSLSLACLPFGSAMADTFWRNVLSSGATTATTYATTRDHKLVLAAQDDAGTFIASQGAVRGPYLEAALQRVRAENPGLNATDEQLAVAILNAEESAAR